MTRPTSPVLFCDVRTTRFRAIQLPGREPLAVAVAEPAPDQAAAGELIRG